MGGRAKAEARSEGRHRRSAARRRDGSRSHMVGTALVSGVLMAGGGAFFGLIPTFPDERVRTGSLERPVPAEVTLPRVAEALPVLPQVQPGDPRPGRAAELLLEEAARSQFLGDHFALRVEELGERTPLVRLGGRDQVTPASLVKLLTVTSALSKLGPQHRFETSVTRGATRRDLVLVGGGDPLLTDSPTADEGAAGEQLAGATLVELARATAQRFEGAGVRRLRLTYDSSLFSGPAVNPAWRSTYVEDSVVAPISALWSGEAPPTGRGGPASRRDDQVPDPARAAAQRFAALLRSNGLSVAPDVTAARASPTGALLARVESPPLDRIVEHVIAESDNEASEILLRQVALATGRPGSTAAGIAAVRQTLARLGLELTGVTIRDGSGLARSAALPLRTLLDVLQLAADPAHPELRSVVTSLPVAAFNGTLAYRFHNAPAGAGLVRAKTGTLSGVHGLAGLVSTRDGRTLAFAAVADAVPVRRSLAARAQLDRVAALLTRCGCAA